MAVAVLCGCGRKPELTPGLLRGDTLSIAYLKSLYKGTPSTINSEARISGVVVSDDRFGNFYHLLVIQDATAGIEISLDKEGIFDDYAPGYTVVVYCNSLTLGKYGGAVRLGAASGDGLNETDPIPEVTIATHLRLDRTTPRVVVDPLPATIGGLTPALLSRLVTFDQVQFIDREMDMCWCGEPGINIRHLVDRQSDTLQVVSSSYATFALMPLPSGSGAIQGVLGYFGGRYQLTVHHSYGAMMTSPRF